MMMTLQLFRSPSGVGVMPVTSMNFPSGFAFRRSAHFIGRGRDSPGNWEICQFLRRAGSQGAVVSDRVPFRTAAAAEVSAMLTSLRQQRPSVRDQDHNGDCIPKSWAKDRSPSRAKVSAGWNASEQLLPNQVLADLAYRCARERLTKLDSLGNFVGRKICLAVGPNAIDGQV